MLKQVYSVCKMQKYLNRLPLKNIFIGTSVNINRQVGIGIYAWDFMYSLRFLDVPILQDNNSTLLLHQMCSVIYLYRNNYNRYFCSGPITFSMNCLLLDQCIVSNSDIKMIPYINTLRSLLHNVDYSIKMKQSHKSDLGYVMSNRLAKYASSLNNTQCIRQNMKLVNGESINVDFMLCE